MGGCVRVEVRLEHETIWLTQEQMSRRELSVITRHIGNVFREGELDSRTMCKIYTLLAPISPVKFCRKRPGYHCGQHVLKLS